MNLNKQMKAIEKAITKAYGKKCKAYQDGCCVCRVWFLYDNLKDYLEFAELLSRFKHKVKK